MKLQALLSLNKLQCVRFIWLSTACLFWVLTCVPAKVSAVQKAILPEAKLLELASHKQWLALIHFHATGFDLHPQAQADGEAFYLSAEKTAIEELRQTLELFSPANVHKHGFNMAVACRYPARLAWLKQVLPENDFIEPECPEFENWKDKIDAASLTLVFPAAYLNSPSSMYGHTFIRVDRKKGNNPLLDYSVNFAANNDPDDMQIVFAYKGLTGGYAGVYSVLPYYKKVNEYSYLESRDVWEYRLNLNEEEVDQFVRHVWEVKDTRFDYYFFDENCAYQLLTLLDAASERVDLSRHFRFSAIPTDTVKEIVAAGLVESSTFRPSTLSRMQFMINQLSQRQREAALMLGEPNADINKILANFTEHEQAQILELAFQYSRYLKMRKKDRRKGFKAHSLKLLSARSKLKPVNVFKAYPIPAVRDDQGHASRRLQVGKRYAGSQDFLSLELRAAYHDQLDPVAGFQKGAQLEMFRVQFAYSDKWKNPLRLQHLSLIDIASYSSRNDFITPASWRVSTGFTRPYAQPDLLSPYLNGGRGVTYTLLGHSVYGLWEGQIMLDKDMKKGLWLASGPLLGYLIQKDKWAARLELRHYFDLWGADYDSSELKGGVSLNLTQSLSFRAELGVTRFKTSQNTKLNDKSYGLLLSYFY